MKRRSSVASVSRVCVVGICIVSVFAATFITAGRSDSVPRCCRSVQLSSWLVTSECEALQEVILRFCFPSRYKCTIFSHLEDTSHLSSLSSGEGKSHI